MSFSWNIRRNSSSSRNTINLFSYDIVGPDEEKDWVLALTDEGEATYMPLKRVGEDTPPSSPIFATLMVKTDDLAPYELQSKMFFNGSYVYDRISGKEEIKGKMNKVYLEYDDIKAVNINGEALEELTLPPNCEYVCCWGNNIKEITLPKSIKFLNCDADVSITNLDEIFEYNPDVHILMV